MKEITLASLMVSAFLGYSTEAQNLIQNGSFESPSVPPNIVSRTTPTSWLASGPVAALIHGDYSPSYPLPQDGDQYAALGNSSSLSQEFGAGSPGTYALTWFDSSECCSPDQFSPYSVSVTDSGGNIVTNADFDSIASGPRIWTLRSMKFTLAAGTYTLRFDGHTGVFAELSLLDNISLAPSGFQGACPCEGPVSGGTWKNHGQYVSCVAKAGEAAQNDGLITEDEKDRIVEEAAQSTCGKK